VASQKIEESIKKWRKAELKERSASQEHFIDLSRLLDEKTPAEADPKGEWYCLEAGALKSGGGEGFADVWMRDHFAWESKGKKKISSSLICSSVNTVKTLEIHRS
jgi:hypothetical protein